MLPYLKLELDSVQLFEAQAKTGARLKAFEEVKRLDAHEYEVFIGLLREYSQMLQMELMRNYAVVEKKEEPKKVIYPGRLHEELPLATVGYADKDEVLGNFNYNFKKAFGRDMRPLAKVY